MSETEVDDEIDPNSLTADELREEIAAREDLIRSVTEQLDENDLNRRWLDQAIRREMLAERRVAIEEKRQLRVILATKTQPVAVQGRAKSDAMTRQETMRMQLEAAERKRVQKIALAQFLAPFDLEREQHRTKLFVRAAQRHLDKQTFEAIWDLARELWPDAKGWAELPSPP